MNIKILHVLLFWLLTFCHKNVCLFCIIGIINYMRERSRRKPVDEEDTKLGRWVFFRIFEIHATVFWIYMYYGILFFGYTSTVFTASRLYYYICILHCALASLALYFIILSNFAPVIELSFGSVFFVSSVFTLFWPSSSYYFFISPIIWLDLNASHREIFLSRYLHDSANACNSASHNRVSSDRKDDSDCDDGGRVAILNVRE